MIGKSDHEKVSIFVGVGILMSWMVVNGLSPIPHEEEQEADDDADADADFDADFDANVSDGVTLSNRVGKAVVVDVILVVLVAAKCPC